MYENTLYQEIIVLKGMLPKYSQGIEKSAFCKYFDSAPCQHVYMVTLVTNADMREAWIHEVCLCTQSKDPPTG